MNDGCKNAVVSVFRAATAKWEVVMAAALQYGRERALLGRSLVNFMRIARDNSHRAMCATPLSDAARTAVTQ
jgi:hypothetical protein